MLDQLAPQLEAGRAESRDTRVLIVDDDPSITDVLAVRLGRQGFTTDTANNGRRAVELAREHRPDLVVLDICLPDMDGLTLCQALVDDPTTAGVPVIMLSGMERPDVIRRSRAAGCQYYVRKPYDPNALLVLIEQAIGECRGTGDV